MTSCPTCEEEFSALGQHWRLSDCPYPTLSEHQEEVITGLLMGDGTVHRGNRNPRIVVCMITRPYLEFLDQIFPHLGTGVRKKATAEEEAKRHRESGFNPNANSDNYHDQYEWRTRTYPKFSSFESWYFTGEKLWPSKIKLTPVVLKHWYCGDGSFRNKNNQRYITIAMDNERENKRKVERYFKDGPGVEVSNWAEAERESGSISCSASFTVDDSRSLFKYMGNPPPGFEYKWPDDF